jgi:potassium-transporting ATPase KdpC subunit
VGKQFVIALRVTLVTLILTGILYPLAVTGVAGVLFPHQAAGSLVKDDRGSLVGSSLLGQTFANPAYFQGRLSAAGAGYDATASSGSNLGPTSQKLKDRLDADIARIGGENPGAGGVPDELVTASGSGLDPHISPASARWQVPRIARLRNADEARILGLVDAAVEGRELGFLGEPRVNVLLLNLTLDRQLGRPAPPATAPAP